MALERPELYPQLHCKITAPLSAAYLIAWASAKRVTPLSPENNWQDIIFTPELSVPSPPAIPDTPIPLLLTAAIVPATCVP